MDARFGLADSKGATTQAPPSLRPTQVQLRGQVVPALLATLKEQGSVELTTGSLIALAKIAQDRETYGDLEIRQVLRPFLKDGSQRVAETACVALGILADPSDVDFLTAVMNGRPRRPQVFGSHPGAHPPARLRRLRLGPDRPSRRHLQRHAHLDRAFADPGFEAPSFAQRDIKVAAMSALGLTPLRVASARAQEMSEALDTEDLLTRQDQVDFLLSYLDESKERSNSRSRHHMVQAHAPTALARLLSDGDFSMLPYPGKGGQSPNQSHRAQFPLAHFPSSNPASWPWANCWMPAVARTTQALAPSRNWSAS